MGDKQRHRLLILLFVAVCLAGCGIKGPPLPPLQGLPNAVNDLEKTISGNIIVLTWSIPPEKDHAVVERFTVYRSRIDRDVYCPGCPPIFKQVSDISIGSDFWAGGINGKVSYSESLEAGNQYTYKVVGYTWDNVASGDSNLVEFDF